ncbi:uncharacterized protein LOC130671586 [Microplitis mediator]|uniref:uncharacterized protein LOC130671586 n=1 Tax=Microplitis mediator TaxID=375433 RepID=UPI002553AC66|nr:uncharacterized protein LOC130671586 [Microplitis mediator]
MMEESKEELEYTPEDVIIISDQKSLIETLIKNLGILRSEIRHCNLIDSEFETNLELFKESNNNLIIKLQSLSCISEQQINSEMKNKISEFVEHVYQSWEFINKQISEEYAKFFVASRTVYGVALTSLLHQIKKQVGAIKISLKLGESIYDKEYIIKGHMYCCELTKLLTLLEGCDEKVQQYLMISKSISNIQKLNSIIDHFSISYNLLTKNNYNEDSKVFNDFLFKLLTGEIFGWEPVNPDVILKENIPKKPVFITKNNNRRTQLKSLQHLPLFH